MAQFAPTYMTVYDTDADALAAPVNMPGSPPRIIGPVFVGSRLTASTGVWTGYPAPVFTFQWKRDGVAIAGATAQTYLPVSPADDGVTLTVDVTGTNSQGNATATSNGKFVPDSTP